MYDLKQSTAITVPFFAHDVNGDAVTGLTDGSFTKRISKGSGAFAAMTVTVTEMENGWYSIPLTTTHSDTLGLLTVVFTNAGAKQVNLQWRVQARIADDLAFPSVSGRNFVVETDGMIHADLKEWLGSVPTVLSGGVVACRLRDGAHGGASAVLTLERFIAASTTAGEPAMKLTGNTSGPGLESTGGATGPGIRGIGGATSGNGMNLSATNGDGINSSGGTGGHGMRLNGNGSGEGLVSFGGDTGHGIQAVGGSTSGDAFKANVTSGNEFSGSLSGSVNSIVTGVTVATNNDKTGYALTVADKDDIVDRTWDEVLTGATHNVTNSSGKRLRQIEAAFVITSGTAQAGGTNTITLASGESVTDNIFNGDRVVIVGGTGIGEHGIIIAYDGGTKIATMSQDWVITPDVTSEYDITPADVDVETIENSKAAADNLKLDYDGTGLDKSNSTIGTATNLTTNNDKTGYSISGSKTTLDALNDISAAQVNTEVVDALVTDTYAETASVIAATASLKDKIGWLFTLARNKITQTSSTQTLRNDADAADIGTAAVSDDGTTATRDEWT